MMEIVKRGIHRLRELEESDLEQVLSWRNSAPIRAVSNSDHLITLEEHLNWFKGIRESRSGRGFIFEVEGKPVGVVNISGVDTENKRCRWGFYLGEASSHKGWGSMMGFLTLEYLFETLNFEKVCAEVLGLNLKGLEFHKKLGFVEEGRLTHHVFRDGKWWDLHVMAHFRDRWDKRKIILEENFSKGAEGAAHAS